MQPRGAVRPRAVARIPRVCAPTHGEDVRAGRCRRGVDHEVALSARGCRRRGELSKVKVTNRLFFFFPLKVKVSGLPRPVIATQPTPHLSVEASPGLAASPHPGGRLLGSICW